VEESTGLISSWEAFERFPWDEIVPDYEPYELVARCLPEGMKVVVEANFSQVVFDILLGFEGVAYMLYDEPELVAQVFARWGQEAYDLYASVVGMAEVGALFHADDLGYNTATFLAPALLRQHIFPWLKRYAALAHDHGKMFWLHCCGNLYSGDVIEDLIEEVQIDALHSFQDVILPVTAFQAAYGDRVATLGGVDMDALARMDEPDLRRYVRDILARCMPGGRYALGSGNTLANYIPLRNYAAMLDEGRRWQPPG
jgi:uroporphyrinogen decarboxylase